MIIPIAIMAVVLLASGAVWCFVFTGRIPEPVEPESSRPALPKLNYPALVLVLYLCIDRIAALFSTLGRPGPRVEISVDNLHTLIATNLGLLALMVGLCLLSGEVSIKDYGVHLKRWSRQLAVGGLAFLASWLPVFLLLLATSPLRTQENLHPLLQLIHQDQSGETLVWIGVAVVFVAPLWEEFAYRVILQTSLGHWMPSTWAVPLTAVVFSAVHGWPDLVPILPLALVLGAVYHHYHSYLAVVLAHALFNGAMLAMALVSLSVE